MFLPKTILVTGANRGIGLGYVKEFLKSPDVLFVFAAVRNVEKAEELSAISDTRLHVLQMDVDDDESIERAVKEVEAILGDKGLDVLINNAGIYIHYKMTGKPVRADMNNILNTNATSQLVVSQYFFPLLQKAVQEHQKEEEHRSIVVNMSSRIGSIGQNETGSSYSDAMGYRASKACLNQIGRTLGMDWLKYRTVVVNFSPGWVKTDMGGDKGFLTVEECCSKLVASICRFTLKDTGGFFTNTGEPVPY